MKKLLTTYLFIFSYVCLIAQTSIKDEYFNDSTYLIIKDYLKLQPIQDDSLESIIRYWRPGYLLEVKVSKDSVYQGIEYMYFFKHLSNNSFEIITNKYILTKNEGRDFFYQYRKSNLYKIKSQENYKKWNYKENIDNYKFIFETKENKKIEKKSYVNIFNQNESISKKIQPLINFYYDNIFVSRNYRDFQFELESGTYSDNLKDTFSVPKRTFDFENDLFLYINDSPPFQIGNIIYYKYDDIYNADTVYLNNNQEIIEFSIMTKCRYDDFSIHKGNCLPTYFQEYAKKCFNYFNQIIYVYVKFIDEKGNINSFDKEYRIYNK